MPPLERKVEVKEKKPKKNAAAAGGADANAGKKNKKAEAQPAAETKSEAPVEAAKPAAEGEKPQGQKKEKKPKEKKPEGDNKKPAKATPPPPTGPLPSMIDLRVGKVLEGLSIGRKSCRNSADRASFTVSRHPDADSLYVEVSIPRGTNDAISLISSSENRCRRG
jgi:aminoacyl tRNA synthase complex-interacting multifunctional protein 1